MLSMTSEEENGARRTQSPEQNRGMLSSEDTELLQDLCSAIRNVQFKKIQGEPGATPTTTNIPADPNTSQTGSDGVRSRQARGLTSVDPNPNDSNASPEGADDREADMGGDVRSDTPASDTENLMSDKEDVREDKKKAGAMQTTATPSADAIVTRKSASAGDAEDEEMAVKTDAVVANRPSVDAGGAVEENNELEEDISHQVYKGFKEVYDKLQLLENAISRLGGVGDALSGIREMRAALFIALRWDNSYYFRKRVRKGELDSAEKVLPWDWGDLAEDGTVFRSGTDDDGKPITTPSDVKLLLKRIWLSASTMQFSFEELGSVNGCQFNSLCSSLRAVWYELYHILWSGYDRKRLFQELPKFMFALSEEISKAIERDIPNLRTAEQRLTDKYTSMTTTAAFFSGITITAIQTQLSLAGNHLADAVNTIWVASLVLSVASVMASLIASSYFQSHIPIRTKENVFKRGVIFLLRNGPAMFMTAAAATFMIGLALFVNASNQIEGTSKIATRLIISVSAVLVFLTLCFAVFYVSGYVSALALRLCRKILGGDDRNWRSFLYLSYWNRFKLVTVALFKPVRDVASPLWRKLIDFGVNAWGCVKARIVYVSMQRNAATATNSAVSMEDVVEDRPEDFLAVADSDPEPLESGKIQVALGKFDGPLVVANSETSSLQIYKAFDDTSPIPSTAVSTTLGDVKQLLWSPDNAHLLIRMDNSLSIWSESDNVLRPIPTSSDAIGSDAIDSAPIKVAIWMSNSNVLAITSKSYIRIDRNTGKTGDPKRTPDDISIISAQHLIGQDNEYLVCIADRNINGTSIRKLLVMDYTTGTIVHEETKIEKTPESLRLCEGEELTKVLLSFVDGSAPQLWHLKEVGLRSWEMEFKFDYDTGESIQHSRHTCSYPASFAGSRNGLVVYDAKAESISIWSTDDATLKHSIDISGITFNSGFSKCISWKVDDSDTPTTLALAIACNNGKVVKGKINFSDSIADQMVLHESDVQVVNIEQDSVMAEP